MKSFKRLLAIQVFLFHPEMIGAMKLSLRQTNEDNVDTNHRLQQTEVDATGEHSSNGERNLKYKNRDTIFSIENKHYSNVDTKTEQYEEVDRKETNVFYHEEVVVPSREASKDVRNNKQGSSESNSLDQKEAEFIYSTNDYMKRANASQAAWASSYGVRGSKQYFNPHHYNPHVDFDITETQRKKTPPISTPVGLPTKSPMIVPTSSPNACSFCPETGEECCGTCIMNGKKANRGCFLPEKCAICPVTGKECCGTCIEKGNLEEGCLLPSAEPSTVEPPADNPPVIPSPQVASVVPSAGPSTIAEQSTSETPSTEPSLIAKPDPKQCDICPETGEECCGTCIKSGKNKGCLECTGSIVDVQYEDLNANIFMTCETLSGKNYKVKAADKDFINSNFGKGKQKSGEVDLIFDAEDVTIDDSKCEIVSNSPPGLKKKKRNNCNGPKENNGNGPKENNGNGPKEHECKGPKENNGNGPHRRKLQMQAIGNCGTYLEGSCSGNRTILAIRVIAADKSTTASESELAESIFENADSLNLQSWYKQCSYNQLNFVPAEGTGINNGVYTVTVPSSTTQGDAVMNNEIVAALNMDFNVTSPIQIANHIMFCLPPGTMNGIAYANINHWRSVYSDNWCTYVSAQAHEIGHNLMLAHSGDPAATGPAATYGDQSGMMGFSYSNDDGPRQCFNAPKNWQLGWYDDKKVSISFNGWEGNLIGLSDYENPNVAEGDIVIAKSDLNESYYVSFNRKIGINSGTVEGGDKVMVHKRDLGTDYGESHVLEYLNSGESYTSPDTSFVVTVNSIDLTSDPARANIKVERFDPPPACYTGTASVSINPDPYPGETSWDIVDEADNVVASGTSTGASNIALPNGYYTFSIYDSYADGICCQFGNGSYTFQVGNTALKTGGEFESQESTGFGLCNNVSPIAAPTNVATPTFAPSTTSPTMASTNAPTPLPIGHNIPLPTPLSPDHDVVTDAVTPTASPVTPHIPSNIQSVEPSSLPSFIPSMIPSSSPSLSFSTTPNMLHSDLPSKSDSPSLLPSSESSLAPSGIPSTQPSMNPSVAISEVPSATQSEYPSQVPSNEPSHSLSSTPSDQASQIPSKEMNKSPSNNPTSQVPSATQSDYPSQVPSNEPSHSLSSTPSDQASQIPSKEMNKSPSNNPTSQVPSSTQSDYPSQVPSNEPSHSLSSTPSDQASQIPSKEMSKSPSNNPTSQVPSSTQSDYPSQVPSNEPSHSLSSTPSDQASQIPSKEMNKSPSNNPTSQVPSSTQSDYPSQVPSNEPSHSLSSTPSDQASQIPSKEMSKSPSNKPTPSSFSFIPSDNPTKINCELSGRQILTLNGKLRKCKYIARNANKVCIRGDRYCANESGNLVRDYSNVCCDSCNKYYKDASCIAVTSAPAGNTAITFAPTTNTCKSTTIEVKLNDEINENIIELKKYDPSTGRFSIRKFAKWRKFFNEANKVYNFDVGCLETDACYRFVFRDKNKETGVSDGFLSGDGYVKVVYGGETIRFSKFNNPNRSIKKVRRKFGDSCPWWI